METFTFKTEDNKHTITVDTQTGIVYTDKEEGTNITFPIIFPLLDPPINNSYRSYTQYYLAIQPEFRVRFMLQIKRWKNYHLQPVDAFEGWLYWLENTNPPTAPKTITIVLNDILCGRYYFSKSGLPNAVCQAFWRAFMRACQLPDYERIKPFCALLQRENTASLLSASMWEYYFYEKLRHNDNFADVRNIWNDMVKVMERREQKENDI